MWILSASQKSTFKQNFLHIQPPLVSFSLTKTLDKTQIKKHSEQISDQLTYIQNNWYWAGAKN